MAQKLSHAAEPTPTTVPFPFEDLPMELQRMVLRYATPSQGLLPRLTLQPGTTMLDVYEDRDWTPYEDDAF